MKKSREEVLEQTLTQMRDANGITEFTAKDVSRRTRDYSTVTVSNILKFTRGIFVKESIKTHKRSVYAFIPGATIEVEH